MAAIGAPEIIALIIAALTQGPQIFHNQVTAWEQSGELTPEQAAKARADYDAAMQTRRYKTDDQVPTSQGGTGPG